MKMVTNAAGRGVPTEINGEPVIPYKGVNGHRVDGRKHGPPVPTCADFPSDGNKLAGSLEPASESPLHLAVYQKRPDVMAIAHTHSPMVVTLSIAGVPLRTVENQGASVIGKEAPVFEKYGLVDSFELGRELAQVMGSHNFCVLKSHGNLVAGKSIEEVCVHAIWGEKAARYQYQAMLLGEPHWYPEKEIEKMIQQQIRGKGFVRTWNYYKWKITR